MRFGINTFLTCPGFTDSDLHLIQEYKNYGAETIELAIADPSAVTVSKLKKALEDAELDTPPICGAFGPGRDLRGSPEASATATQYISDLIEIGQAIGSKIICGPLYSEVGRAGPHTADERERQLEQIASALKPLCEKAKAAGITLALEPLNRFETDCINTLEQAVSMIQRVGSDALKIHIDTFHMNIEEDDSAAAIIKAGDYIGHIHASASHRGLLGQDQVDWTNILNAISKIGYDGDIVIESFSEDNTIIAKAAAIWRTLYESPEQLSVEGLKFLKENWKSVRS